MRKRATRFALLSTVSWTIPAVPAAFLVPAEAQAQTVCSGVPVDLLECVEGVTTTATGTVNAGTVVVPGPGLVATSAADLITTVTGNITTTLDNEPGVSLLAVDDLVFDIDGTVTTLGDNSEGVIATAGGDIDAITETIVTLGDNSDGFVLTADNITAICGTVTTAGSNSIGVNATAAAALDFTCATVATTGAASDGVILNGTDIVADVGTVTTDGIGSDALIATATGNLDITSDTIATLQDDSDGLVLTADNITAICGTVTTAANNSIGVNATAAGTLDFTCATVETSGQASDGVVLTGTDIAADIGTVTTDGIGSDAVTATATGDLDITSDTIVTLQDDSGGLVLSAENVTAICGSVTTSGNNSIAVDITATGSVVFACDAVDTGGDDSPGTVVDGGEDPIDVDVGETDTDGDNSPGVVVDGTGPIDVNADDTTTNGDNSPGIVITGDDDPVNLTCGRVETFGDNSPGVDVDSNGAIAVDCDVVITHGDVSDGIQVTGDTGPVSVTVNEVTTEGADSDGIDVTTSTGDQTIVAGTVDVSGPGSDGISAVATGCADINITATGEIVSADGTAILASSLCSVTVLTEPGASVIGADAGIDVTSGTGATITLNDSVEATDGPAINVDGAAALINVNEDGSIIGAIDLTDENDTLNNAGLFDVIGTSDFGAGIDIVNNSGIVSSVNGDGVLANCETFNNSGRITMIDGAANDTLTVCGNYVGSGDASLGIDVGGGAGGLTADRLIVPGDASGSTDIDLGILDSVVVDPEGVLVVDADTSTANPFTLTGPTSAGLINFALDQRGADTFLVSTPDELIFDFATLGLFGGEMWYQSGDAHKSCSEARRNAFGLEGRSPLSICGQVYYGEERTGGDRIATVFDTELAFSDRLKTKRYGVQLDVGYRPGPNFEVGLTGGYQRATADLASSSDLRARGYNIGAYAEYGMATGFYAAALVKYDVNRVRFENPLIDDDVRPRVKSTGVDGEVGYRTPALGAILDLNAGLTYVRTRVRDFDAGLISFDEGRADTLRGRLGGRLTWAGDLGPFVDAKLFHEFDGDSRFSVGSGSFFDDLDGRGRGTWGRLEGGIAGGAFGGPLLSAWVDFGDVRGWGVRAGYRFGGAAAAAPPPPMPVAPAPPPPEAPATMTCPDGTVILATEVCPAPPPPPPPPAPAPERG